MDMEIQTTLSKDISKGNQGMVVMVFLFFWYLNFALFFSTHALDSVLMLLVSIVLFSNQTYM